MNVAYSQIEQQLHAAEGQISECLNRKDLSVAELEHLESWLFNQSEKVRLHKLKGAGCESSSHVEKQNIRYDGVIIFDSQFNIHYCTGPSYYFPVSISGQKSSICFQELINPSDQEKLQACVIEAHRNLNNVSTQLVITSPDGTQSSCTFEVNGKASNFYTDRIVVF